MIRRSGRIEQEGTADDGIVYGRDQGKHVDVDGFVDVDYAKDPDKDRSVVVICDNQGAIHLSRNAMFHERTKHINMRYHFIRDIVESREIEVAKMDTKDNAADAFTKVVPGLKSKYFMEILAVEANYSCH
ncbi:hypothetical protein Tco_1312298 [Tanacetum coccineum]